MLHAVCKVSELMAANDGDDEGEGSVTGGRADDMDTDDLPLAQRLRSRLE